MMRLKETTAPANPTTSEAVNCTPKVCGNSSGEVNAGVVPENEIEFGSKVSHDGRGVLLAEVA
jgi:hypothetical protein